MSLGWPAAITAQRDRIAARQNASDPWHDPARQAARDAVQEGWARHVLADPAAHSPARIRRAKRILSQKDTTG